MQPVAAAVGWGVPPLVTLGELAGWLRVRAEEVEWFADLRRWNLAGAQPHDNRDEAAVIMGHPGCLGHYYCR